MKTRFNGQRNSHYNARNNDLSPKNEKFAHIDDYTQDDLMNASFNAAQSVTSSELKAQAYKVLKGT